MRLKTILIVFVLLFSLATAVEAGWKPDKLPLENQNIYMNSPADTIVYPFIKIAVEPLISGIRPLHILSHNASTNDNFTLAKGDPHSTCPPSIPNCHLILTDIEPNWIGEEEVTVGAGPTGAVEVTTFFVRVNDNVGLSISNFECDRTSYFEGENVQCSAKITWAPTGQVIENATLEIHDDGITPTLLGSCTTDASGECTAIYRAQSPGQRTVYANAFPQNHPNPDPSEAYLPYTAKLVTETYTTESAYQIQDLTVYNESLDQEDTFNRSERYYVSFNVYDVIGDVNVTPSPTPVDYSLQVNLVKGASSALLTYDHADGATFYYTQQVPLSDDFLGSSEIVVFFEDTTPEHKSTEEKTPITVLNNEPVISYPDTTLRAALNKVTPFDFGSYGNDEEDGNSLTWTVGPHTGPFNANFVGTVLEIEGTSLGSGSITVKAEDSDGGYDELTLDVVIATYQIQNLKTYNASSEQDTEFYRGEAISVSFNVYDALADVNITLPGDFEIQVNITNYAGYTETLSLDTTIGDTFYYSGILSIASDGLLNNAEVVVFFENTTSLDTAQSTKQIDVLNNPPEIKNATGDPIPPRTVVLGSSVVVDLSEFESDVEDSAGDFTWRMAGLSSNLNASLTVITGKTLTIVPNSGVTSDSEYVKIELEDSDDGVAAQTIDVTITTGHNQPSITTTSLPNARVNELYQHTIEATDADLPDDVLNFTYDLDPFSLDFKLDPKSGEITWTPTVQGTYSLEVNVTDLDGLKDSKVFTIDVVSANDPEFVTALTADTHFLGHGTYYRDLEVKDDDGDTVTVTVLKPDDMTYLTGSKKLQWPATSIPGKGTYAVEIELDDGTGNVVLGSYQLTVFDSANAPIFTSTPVTEAYVGEPYTYDADAIDPDNESLTYSLVKLPTPTDMQINPQTGEITWTSPIAGIHTVRVQVTDGTNTATQEYTLTVYLGQHIPLITSTPVTTATESVLYTYQVIASDPDVGDTLTFSLLKPPTPTDMQIDPQTGLIAWTPTLADAQQSPHTVRVQVSDGAIPNPNTDVQEYQLTVYLNEPVSFTLTADKLSGEGPLTVEFQITDLHGNPPISYEWDFGDGTNSNERNPTHTFTDPGTYTVQAIVTDVHNDTATNSIVISVDEEHKDLPREKVKMDSLNVFNADTLFPGDYATLRIKFTNNDNYDMKRVKVTARIDDLGSRASIGPFNVESGDTVNRNLILDIPYDAMPGEYLVRVIMTQGGRVVRVKHRFVTVNG